MTRLGAHVEDRFITQFPLLSIYRYRIDIFSAVYHFTLVVRLPSLIKSPQAFNVAKNN
jgi:hypothetical protein